jgi:uncharacterized DUF497 family protein
MGKGGSARRAQPEFNWEGGNEEKLLMRHNVSALEAEQCFANPHTRRTAAKGDYLLFGKTDGGRLVLLVYQQKPRGVVRVYSARKMNTKERRLYRREAR